MHAGDALLQRQHLRLRQNRSHAYHRILPADRFEQDAALRGFVRIADGQPHQKTIELTLRQRVCAVMLQRVLRRHHQKRARQGVRALVDRDTTFLHRLQQTALRARRRPVDLVSDHDVREDRARPHFERRRLWIVQRYTQDVRGQQVARELHAPETQTKRRRERTRQRRLADTRNVFEQDVTTRQQRRQRKSNDVRLSVKYRLDPADQLTENCEIRYCFAYVFTPGESV